MHKGACFLRLCLLFPGVMKPISTKAVLFDLDGTLLDTIQDLSDAVNEALAAMGYPSHSSDEYKLMIGEGVQHLAECALPSTVRKDAATMGELVVRIREEYTKRWNVKTVPYNGVMELLNELTARNIALAVLSNKPHDFTRLSVDHFLSQWRFDSVVGQRPGVPIKPDPSAALQTAIDLGVAPEAFLYLGDSGVDMQTACGAGMLPIGALWGFRRRDELLACGARHLIEHPLELLNFLS
jgi:phosphoglycolate phosphatase